MGFDVKAWLSSKLFGTTGPQQGVSGYAKPKRSVTEALDRAGDIDYPRRGDTDEEYNPYDDRDLDLDAE